MRLYALIVLAILGWPAWAQAHSTLVSVDPPDGSVLTAAPAAVRLRFNEPITPTVVQLVDATGRARPDVAFRTENDTITLTLPPGLPTGTEIVSYRIVSADGHPVGGSVLFSIGAPSGTAPAATADPVLAAAIWLTRVGLYVGLFVGIGGAVFLAWLAPVRPARRIVVAALGFGAASAALALGLQGLDLLGLPLQGLARSSAWVAAVETTLAWSLAAAVVGFGLAALSLRSRNAARPLSVLALLCVGATLALSGHAATAPPQELTRVAIFVHGVCVAVWVGALAPLLVMTHQRAPALKTTLGRFSDIAVPLVGVLVLTGLTLATIQVETPSALLTTDYGRLLVAKLTAVAGLLVLATLNRFRFMRGADSPSLRRSIAAEGALALVIFGIVAGWRFTTPPRTAVATAHTVVLSLQGVGGMADGTATPARVGSNSLEFTLMDASMAALTPRAVTVTFGLPSAGIEPVQRTATLSDSGLWRVDDVVPQPGRWHVTVEALIDDFHEVSLEGDFDVAP